MAITSFVILACLLCVSQCYNDIQVGRDKEKDLMATMANQLMMQQFNAEERIRSEGGSGIKQMRHMSSGTRPYFSPTHSGNSAAGIHDHANYINTIGLGEFIAVLNGVEFRTRHNDYKLVKPHSTSKDYHATEKIEFPEVPPAVLQQTTVEGQIREMKEWFKAFLNQDYSVRDYRAYFRPVLCYMEGHWTFTSDNIDESFESDRHAIDAASWKDLQDKVRFTSYSGAKDNLENFAYLPTTIIDVRNGTPAMAQWNYRLLCHPLKDDLPLNRFRVVDDLGARLVYKKTLKEHSFSRAARFQLNPYDTDEWIEGKERHGLLDELMQQIPGVDNYQADLRDEAFNILAYQPVEGLQELNAGYYHRWYKVNKKGAMGLSLRHRGFSDSNVFMAMTTNPKVPAVGYEACKGNGRRRRCEIRSQRWTYAVPLEIVYMTPLTKWNPYNIHYKGESSSELGKTVRQGKRNGVKSLDKAFNGTNHRTFYMTPSAFYSGRGLVTPDAADTSSRHVGVLNKDGDMVLVGASGHRIMFTIGGVGTFRQRYPIFPVHGQGGAVWKELEALKDIVLAPMTYNYMFHEPFEMKATDQVAPEEEGIEPLVLEMLPNARADHSHIIELSALQVAALLEGRFVVTNSEEAEGHSHNVKIKFKQHNDGTEEFIMTKCDGARSCEHIRKLDILADYEVE